MRQIFSAIGLALLAFTAQPQPGAPYPGYRQPWQPPPGQWNYAPPDQRPTGTPSGMPTSPNMQYPYSSGWPTRQQPGYAQAPSYYSPSLEPPRLQISLSGTSPFVQENLLLRLELISSQNLKTATPQLPQTDSLVFQKIEGPSVSSRKRKGSQEIVTRFIYQITPLRPGRIEIPPIHVTGAQETGAGYGRSSSDFDAASQQPLVLNVKPSDPSSTPWLPLEQLNLKTLLPKNLKAAAGKPMTLTIETHAVGASGNLLPSLESQLKSKEFRVYRDKTRTTTNLNRKGTKIIGRRVDTFTLVPQYGGDLRLPNIRLSWWNTKNDTAQYTSIPIKPIAVSGDGLRGEGMFGLTKTSTLFPGGSPAAFWIPVSVIFGVIFGYWLAVWISNRRKEETPIAAFAPLTNAMKRPFRNMAPAFAPLGEKFRATTAVLNPLTRWQKLRRYAIGMLPLSIRFWYCVRFVEEENDPDVWGYTLRFLANKHLNMPQRAPFADIGNRILEFHPKADPMKIRQLIHDLDQSIYGHSTLDFEQWKQDFKSEIRPRLKLFAGKDSAKAKTRDEKLPSLNPLAV